MITEHELKVKVEEDPVNKPRHYNKSRIECIHAIEAATGDGYEYYLQGNILTVSYTHLTLPTTPYV